jgi:crotonobetainyl-CoA:carnitine CoA-transferase CaiB-like acyl-CoA transferase
MVQEVETESGARLLTTRCPIRVDGAILTSRLAAPKVGQHTDAISRHYHLTEQAK